MNVGKEFMKLYKDKYVLLTLDRDRIEHGLQKIKEALLADVKEERCQPLISRELLNKVIR